MTMASVRTYKVKVEVGYCVGPYDPRESAFERVMIIPLERDLSPLKVLHHVKPPGSGRWELTAFRARKFWEWRRPVNRGVDKRLVARVIGSASQL